MEPLPTDLIDCILDNFDPNSPTDKCTLLECTLVGKAWLQPAQRRIFQHLEISPYQNKYLDYPNNKCFDIAYLRDNKQFLEILDVNPQLALYTRSLDLDLEFVDQDDKSSKLLSSAFAILSRLTNLQSIRLYFFESENVPAQFRAALTGLITSSSVTRLSLDDVTMLKFSELTFLLSQMSYLKDLRLIAVDCEIWDVPGSTPVNPTLPISLDVLELTDHLDKWVPWFKQSSCPLQLQSLKVLVLGYEGGDIGQLRCCQAKLLKYVGGSIQDLSLQVSSQDPASNVLVHLGYTPNVRTVSLSLVGYYPMLYYKSDFIPWVLALLNPLVDLYANQQICPLRQLSISFTIGSNDPIHAQWDEWAQLDQLGSKPELGFLEDLIIQVKSIETDTWEEMGDTWLAEQAEGVRKVLKDKMPMLEKSGKLKILVPSATGDAAE